MRACMHDSTTSNISYDTILKFPYVEVYVYRQLTWIIYVLIILLWLESICYLPTISHCIFLLIYTVTPYTSCLCLDFFFFFKSLIYISESKGVFFLSFFFSFSFFLFPPSFSFGGGGGEEGKLRKKSKWELDWKFCECHIPPRVQYNISLKNLSAVQ